MLYGRGTECALLDTLIYGAAESRSSVLVLRGEPGVGKSALLGYAAGRGDSLLRLRAAGVESEVHLPYAGLHQLLYPLLRRIDELPGTQSAALRGAVGLAPARGDDRFLVALAVLTLLSDAASDAGLICLVDDAQWLDQPSADALIFTARRLQAEGIVLVFAVREGDARGFEAPGLPDLRLGGLDPADAAALLSERAPSLAPSVARGLVSATGGNPLALLELPSVLTAAQLAGDEPLPEPLPLGRLVEHAFATTASRLPADTRALLLVAAAEETGDLALVLRAADALDIEPTALGQAEGAGLLRISGRRVEFRHPLARSAVYQQATFASRQTAHRALAEALDGDADVDRRAWHLAAATIGADAELAALLEGSSKRARRRAGPAAAAAALERSAALTPDHAERGRRLLAAAEAAWAAGAPQRAVALLDGAEPLIAGNQHRAALQYLRGLVELQCGLPETAYDLLLSAASTVSPDDAHAALEALVLAGDAAAFGLGPEATIEVGRLALALPTDKGAEDEQMVGLLAGVGEAMAGDWDSGARRLRVVARAGRRAHEPMALLRAGVAALYLGDDAQARTLHTRAVEMIRRTGAIGLLPTTLARLAFSDILAGRLADAAISGTESLQLAQDMGREVTLEYQLVCLALLEAWRGNVDACRAYAGQAHTRAAERRLGLITAFGSWALGLLELGRGRPGTALTHLMPMVRGDGRSYPAVRIWATPDLVEAAYRAGQPELATTAMQHFDRWAHMVDLPSAQAIACRCRALLSAGQDRLDTLEAALELHADATRPLEHARTQLVYGEALRRARRRADSRVHLRSAMEDFERLGASPWAERARAELRAAGEATHSSRWVPRDRLTPQELQIARLAAAGASNPDIAGQLFLSRRTVEYHLRKVFTKLDLATKPRPTR